MRFVHTNIIAKDWQKLSQFYKTVFGCKSVPPQRDLQGDWLDRLTGIPGVHIEGEHLLLPGYEEHAPTLEIFSYSIPGADAPKELNRPGFAHIAFLVDDVEVMLQRVLREGGSVLSELVRTEINGSVLTVVYTRDIEGNIIELQSWAKQW